MIKAARRIVVSAPGFCSILVVSLLLERNLMAAAPNAMEGKPHGPLLPQAVELTFPMAEVWPRSSCASGVVSGRGEGAINTEQGGINVDELDAGVRSPVVDGRALDRFPDVPECVKRVNSGALQAMTEAKLNQTIANRGRANDALTPDAIRRDDLADCADTDVFARASLVKAQTNSQATPVKLGQYGSGVKGDSLASSMRELSSDLVLTLPETSVVVRDGLSLVYFLDKDNRVLRRSVQTGRRIAGRVEITSGLNAAMRVVSRGGALLEEGGIVVTTGRVDRD